ncbi:NADH-quinone oxidoreductase subunit NuoG [Dermatobacter hominis]|uniref:NADH-quinone oxidoreductase subunit NuoG n=1 Tax=Dermatobacter hominis TaxID=2884263 RepID=UPI001D0FDAD2|nr:NADH-quinone oxidoreductase subunit NuoG [Dermatobacter hominis]UDY33975.1 NADH-quinone oxidoreductase subunit NuoG [Dermatobacter hominis]
MSERRSLEGRSVEVTDPVTITVNGEEIVAQKGELVIDACERNDAYIPRFCYHPRMEPVGMCRMCLVEIDSGRGPALQPSCMIPVAPDMTVTTDSPAVAKAQDGVIEFLLANHPLDCPVCDKGGECPLQDQSIAYGPGESRWVEEKRHYEKPIAISQTVLLDRERCILCDRCTRFAAEVTDDPLIHFIGRGSNTQVNTFPGEPFSSYFSGNTVQICPVGALTAEPYRFRARPWDLETVESTCTECAVGCRTSIDASRDQVLRYGGIDSDPVNWSWLCDKGRFSFEAVGSPDRLTTPLLRSGSELAEARWNVAIDAAAGAIRDAIAGRGPSGVAVLGGARLTNEAAYAWARLAKGVIGTDQTDAQLGDGLPAEVFDLPGATIDDVCAKGGTVLYLGPDPKEELPVLFLRLKHAMVKDGVRLVQVTPAGTSLSPYAAASVHPRPGESAAVVRALLSGSTGDVGGVAAADLAAAAEVLGGAGDLKVVIGRPNLVESPAVALDAAAAVLDAAPTARFLPVVRRGNTRGAVMAGLAPGRLPGGASLDDGRGAWAQVWPTVPSQPGTDADGILLAAAEGKVDVLVLLGADPVEDFRDRSLARRALAATPTVIVLDRFLTESASLAQIVLPVAGFAECDGTTTNMEGRVTTLNAKVNAPGTARTDWMIAADLAERLGADALADDGPVELWTELVANVPALSHVTREALGEPHNVDGIVTDLDAGSFVAPSAPAVPNPNAYSSRLVVDRVLYDGGETLSHMPSSRPLVRDGAVVLGTADAAALDVEAGTRLTVSSQHGSVTGPLVISDRVPRGTVVLHHALSVDPYALVSVDDVVCDVRVEVA